MGLVTEAHGEAAEPGPQNHRTIGRVTRILEEVVYNPGMTFVELARALDAPKSSVYGFIRGLVAAGWLHEDSHRFYLGPALYGLTMATGRIRAGLVTETDLSALSSLTNTTVFLGVRAGDSIIYVTEAGASTGIVAGTNIRRSLLETAGGKALLAAMPEGERISFLRRRGPDESALVEEFLAEYGDIQSTRIAKKTLLDGDQTAIATNVLNSTGEVVAEITLVGPTADIAPRMDKLSRLLLEHVDGWRQ